MSNKNQNSVFEKWFKLKTFQRLYILYNINTEFYKNLPELMNGIPSNGTYCDFHIRRVEGLAGLGDCRVPQKL